MGIAMIQVDPKSLLQRLDATCTRALEGAAGLCISRSHYDVTVEHMLVKLLEDPTADVAHILARFEVDVGRLASSIVHALDELRLGNAGKPTFSPLLLEWIQDAWLVASIELGSSSVRGAALLRALVAHPRRYLASDLVELERVRPEELRRELTSIVTSSSETTETGGKTSEKPAGKGAPATKLRPDSALARFATDFTQAAREHRIDPVFGRDHEIRQIIDILARRRKNNPIVVGEAGVGKTAVVEGLALRIAEGDVPESLLGVSIFGLDLGLLQAGAGVRGEFENRLKSVIEEVKSGGRSMILFIDEAHTLIGAGAAAGTSDAANLLKPALARGELRTIAATTWAEYKKYFEEDAALARRFQPVKIDEPSIESTAVMLRGLKAKYEEAHGVTVRDDALAAAARLSARYIAGRLLPDKAVDLLDTAAARVKLGQTGKPGAVEDLERRIASLDRELEGVRRDLRGGTRVDPEREPTLLAALATTKTELDGVRARWQAQRDAVKKVLDVRKATGAASSPEVERALGELRALQGADPIVRLEVDPEITAHVVADWTGVPVGRMLRDDAALALEIEARLRERIKGQDGAIDIVGRALRGARAGLGDPNKPLVFVLAGPSGVGKTELGLTVAEVLFGGARFAVSINMSEYQDREMGVSGLIGAKPGYVGYGKGGTLTEAVRQRPYSVVLLDEIEKSCQEVRNLFYQVFDKGTLTDGTGRAIDFKNTVIFLTTNLAADLIDDACKDGANPSARDLLGVIRPLLSRVLQPAWLARTTVVPFVPLGRPALLEIAKLKIEAIRQRVTDAHKIKLEVDPRVVDQVVDQCVDSETGARNIDFILQGTLLPKMSSTLLTALAAGAPVAGLEVVMDEKGEPVVIGA